MTLYPEDFNLHIEVPRGFTQSLQVNAEILTRLGYHHLMCFSTYVACSVQKRQQQPKHRATSCLRVLLIAQVVERRMRQHS